MIPHDIFVPAFPVGCVNASAFRCITILRPKMLATFPFCKLIIESVIDIVVMPVEVVEAILPRSPTCLVDEVGLP